MPSHSPAQMRFMNIIAHSPEFAKKVGVPQSVGEDFHEADKAKFGRVAVAQAMHEGAKAPHKRHGR